MRIRRWKRWLGISVVAAVGLVVGGPYVYFHFIRADAPQALTFSSQSPSTGTGGSSQANGDTDGTWTVTGDSIVGYRVNEVLFGQRDEAVGRTGEITGSMTLSGTTITEADFTVDMTTITSDESRRDDQFQGRIMDTTTYPTSTFRLTEPVELGSIPDEGVERTFEVTGDLTLRGTTRQVTFELSGRISDGVVQVVGQIPITFADWDIPNPSFGGLVTTEDHGILELSLDFAR